jgi:ABC-type branched-subunit amino acid transport system substrate-binding protein
LPVSAQRFLSVLAGLLVGALLLAGCGSSDEAGGPNNASFDLTIGDLVSRGGHLEPQYPSSAKAVRLAADEINQGIRRADVDIKVKLVDEDTRSEAVTAVAAARRLVAEGATCMTGPWGSQDTLLVAQSVATPEGIPIISPSATSAAINQSAGDGEDFVFRTAPSDSLQAIALADVAERVLGGASEKTLSLAARGDAYGKRFLEDFAPVWSGRGGRTRTPVLYDLYGTDSSDNEVDARAIVSGDPDGYVIVDFPENYAGLGTALVDTREFDPRKLFVPDGLARDIISADIPRDALNGAHGTRPAGSRRNAATREFIRLYRSMPGTKNVDTFSEHTFDAAMLCFLAAVRAGSNDPKRIAESIVPVSGPPGRKYDFTQLGEAIEALRRGEEIDYEGVSGPIDLSPAGDPQRATYQEFEYIDGRLVVQNEIEVTADR